MADNYTASPGVGLQFAADDIGGVLYPRIKLQTGADGAAADVSASSPLPVVSTDEDTELAHVIWVAGGWYKVEPESVYLGDDTFGVARVTKRRALLQASDSKTLSLSSSAAMPDYTDISNLADGILNSGDLALRDTDVHSFVIPMAAKNWKVATIGIAIDGGDDFDQDITWSLYSSLSQSANYVSFSKLATGSIVAESSGRLTIGDGAVGQGGTVGGATMEDGAHYSVPAMNACWPYLILTLSAAVAPSEGQIQISVTRMSA